MLSALIMNSIALGGKAAVPLWKMQVGVGGELYINHIFSEVTRRPGFASCISVMGSGSQSRAAFLLPVFSEPFFLSPFGRIAAEQSSRLAKYRTLR